MDSRSLARLVLDEAADVLGELADRLPTAPVPFALGVVPRSRVAAGAPDNPTAIVVRFGGAA